MSGRPFPNRDAELRPAIAEYLRTRVYPPLLLLRVDKIIRGKSLNSRDDHENAGEPTQAHANPSFHLSHRLLLSDGELMIQARLHKSLHYCLESEEVKEGLILDLKKYKLALGNRVNGRGQVLFFAIDDFEVVGATKPWSNPVEELAGGFIREKEDKEDSEPPAKRRKVFTNEPPASDADDRPVSDEEMLSSQEYESDGFETAAVAGHSVRKRRRMLKDLDANGAKQEDSIALEEFGRKKPIPDSAGRLQDERQLPSELRTTASYQPHQAPLAASVATPPFHTLDSLIHPLTPLPSRNYVCSIFAVISWVSTSIIQKPNSPFPPKRHLKIHDPSISSRHSGSTVAVFVDAKTFVPKAGTVALFKGLTMQRWEGEVILNAYAGLRDAKEKWFVHDENELEELGCDVLNMKAWWAERQQGKQGRLLKS